MSVGDRIARFAIAMIAFYLTNDFSLPVNAALPTVSGIFVLTAWLESCPLYTLFCINTRQSKY